MNLPNPDIQSEKQRSPKTFRLVLAIVVFCAGAFFFWNWSNEPRYKGKSVSFWIDQACRKATNSWQFNTEVKEMGPSAVPYLIKELQAKDSPWRNRVEMAKTKLPSWLARRLPYDEPMETVHVRAAYYLLLLGSTAKPALPQLVKLLDTKEGNTQLAVMRVLAALGPDAKVALPKLLNIATNGGGTSMYSQIDAARAAWFINRETNVALTVFEWSHIPSSGMLLNATALVSELGPAAAPVLPDLIKLAGGNSVDHNVRANAALALGRIGIKNDSVMTVLANGTNELDLLLRSNCARSLWALDNQYASLATSLIISEIADEKKKFPSYSNSFVQLSEYLKCDLKAAIPTLQEIAQNGSAAKKQAAEEALKQIEASSATATDHK